MAEGTYQQLPADNKADGAPQAGTAQPQAMYPQLAPQQQAPVAGYYAVPQAQQGSYVPPGAGGYVPPGAAGMQMAIPLEVQPVPQYAVQPGVPAQREGLVARGAWSDGLCDCFDNFESCCLSWFVPPWRWAQTLSHSKLLSFNAALAMYGIPWCLVIVFAFWDASYQRQQMREGREPSSRHPLWWAIALLAVAQLAMIILGFVWRGRLRAKYQIPGNGCNDCIHYTFCPPCSIAQEARHVERDTGNMARAI